MGWPSAKREGRKGLIVPVDNVAEAAVVEGIGVYPVDSLASLVKFIEGEAEINAVTLDMGEMFARARSYPIDPAFNPEGAKYDPARFNPIGSTSTEVSVAVTWNTSPVKSFDDLMTHEATFGATGFRDDTGRFPMLAKRLTGARIKVVTGYPGGNDVTMAMEKREVEGRFGWSWGSIKSRAKPWLEQKKINIILQMGMKKASDLPNVPFIMDYAKTPKDKAALEFLFMPQAAAWPLIAPPDVPADRVAALRAAFQATMKDKEFLAKAAKARLDIEPVSGEEMAANNTHIAGFDHTIIERAKELTAGNPTN